MFKRFAALLLSVTLSLSPVSASENVLATQNKLNALGFDAGTTDGIWGSATKNALIKYLSTKGLKFDGVLDSNEFKMLDLNFTNALSQYLTDWDGDYPFVLSRFNPSESRRALGSGILLINNGAISVSQKNRLLDTSSTNYYDTLKGQIDKKGNVSISFDVNALNDKGSPHKVLF